MDSINYSFDVEKLKFSYYTDKSPISYKSGELMKFYFTLDYGQNICNPPTFFVRWVRTGDDGICLTGMNRISPGTPAEIVTSINQPGFVRIVADLVLADGETFSQKQPDGTMRPQNYDGGAGADVDKILPAGDEPQDFDNFWKKQRAILDKVPIHADMHPVKSESIDEACRERYNVYAVSVSCAGPRPVTGYLMMSKSYRAGGVPAEISFHGYGVGDYSNVRFTAEQLHLADEKIRFDVNAHGYELGREKEYYTDMNKTLDGYALDIHENEDPETSYFLGMCYRVMRAYDFIKTLPQWNGRDLMACGGSQGGLQTVWAASLVPEITVCRPSVTWCSDMAGSVAGRLPGWHPEYRKGLAYYDTVFHSRRLRQTCELQVERFGLGDYVCAPSGVAAHFNAANCKKSAVWVQNSQHGAVPPEVEKHRFFVSVPAGHAITGKAPEKHFTRRESVEFVNAVFNRNKWVLIRPDGTEIHDFLWNGRTDLKKGRASDGGDLPLESTVVLRGELYAEKTGFALFGAGIDWWWNVSVNGSPVFGRIRAVGSNEVGSFSKTDWVFRVPVMQGVNTVEVEVILGQQGVGEMDILPNEYSEKEISQEIADSYSRMCHELSMPDTSRIFRQAGNRISFQSAQPYPAGIQFRKIGTGSWSTIWDNENSCSHEVVLPESDGEKFEIRFVCNIYRSGWAIINSDTVIVTI